MRATVSEIGPLLLARILNPNDIRAGVLTAEPRSRTGDLLGAMAKSAAHAIGSQIGRQIIQAVLGSILGGRSR